MTIHRRSFVKGAVASATLPFIPKMPPIIGGAKLARATSRAWATHFDGQQIIKGSPLGFPTASPYGFLSLWFKSAYSGQQYIIDNQSFLLFSNVPGEVEIYLKYNGWENRGYGLYTLASTTPGNWTHVIATWNLTLPRVEIRVGGSTAVSSDGLANATLPYNVPDWMIGGSRIGPNTLGFSSPVVADITDLYLAVGTPTPININDVISSFWDASTGYPPRRASSGLDRISGIRPQIYLSGPASMFTRNFAAGTWTVFPGNEEDAYTDTSPSSSFTVVGNNPLTDATTDPFQP